MAETYEEPEFEVLREYKRFEVRRYPDSIQARLLTPGTGWSGSSGGFRRIAGYIFGGNERGQSIAMTAPVHMWQADRGSMMAFIMPSEHALEDLPKPNDAEIEVTPVDGYVVAALRFSGFSRTSKARALMGKLTKMAEAEGLAPTGPPILAVYDNPGTTLPFMRRNEILLPIEWEWRVTEGR